ncbi:MAG: metallopeptidase TldD-related protein, partial [Thermoanaerobaculia bacterium]
NLFFDKKLKILSEIPKNLPVIFGEGSGGVLFHEILSHPLEGDVFKNSCYKNKLGEKISKDFLTVYDDPTFKGLPVCRKFDDEGEVCLRKPLLEKGVLKNILCDNYYSKAYLFPPGNARICLENPIPLPRATNTLVQEVKENQNFSMDIYPNFLFIPFIKKASFSPPDKISLLAGPVFYYLNRKLYGKILNLKIEGSIREFLSGIDFVGGKLKNCITFGTCLKDGGKLFVGAASPDLSFLNLRYRI